MKKKRIGIYMNEESYYQIKAKAAQARTNLSEFCLTLVLKGRIESHYSSEEISLMRKLAGISNNVNQISRALNGKNGSQTIIALANDILEKIRAILPK
jgi:hypothetical protein